MNIVLDEAVEEKTGGEKVRLGMVVRKSNDSGQRWDGGADMDIVIRLFAVTR